MKPMCWTFFGTFTSFSSRNLFLCWSYFLSISFLDDKAISMTPVLDSWNRSSLLRALYIMNCFECLTMLLSCSGIAFLHLLNLKTSSLRSSKNVLPFPDVCCLLEQTNTTCCWRVRTKKNTTHYYLDIFLRKSLAFRIAKGLDPNLPHQLSSISP